MSRCPDCGGAGGRMVSDHLDGGSPDYRYERCESCEDFAEERRESERQDAMLEEYVGEEPYYATAGDCDASD